MYPRISDFINDVFGTSFVWPIQSYGFFVALAYIAGTFLLAYEFKRLERESWLFPITKKVMIGEKASVFQILLSAFIGFILGFKGIEAIFFYSEFAANPQEFVLSGRGNFVGGLLFAIGFGAYTWWDKHRKQLSKPRMEEQVVHPHQIAGNALVIAGIFGIIGAKIFNILEDIDPFLKNPIDVLFSFSGLTFLGGLICGSTAVLIYFHKNKINVLAAITAAAVVMPLAYAIGRIGCQVSGDGCWGVYNTAYALQGTVPPDAPQAYFLEPSWLSFVPDWFWAYNYPHNVIKEGVKIANCHGDYCTVLQAPVFPTPLYETLINLVIFGILFSVRKKIKIPGMLFAIYLIFNGLERYFIESIRINAKYGLGGLNLTQAELISIILIIIGAVGIVVLYRFRNHPYLNFEKTQKPVN